MPFSESDDARKSSGSKSGGNIALQQDLPNGTRKNQKVGAGMSKRRITIKGGEVCGFADEVSFDGLEVLDYSKMRVSRVVPKSFLPRCAFFIIRAVVPEQSWVANWTRGWSVPWIVVIDGILYGPFGDRSEAIKFEKEKIYEQGKLRG
jgi:hypothetical protein